MRQPSRNCLTSWSLTCNALLNLMKRRKKEKDAKEPKGGGRVQAQQRKRGLPTVSMVLICILVLPSGTLWGGIHTTSLYLMGFPTLKCTTVSGLWLTPYINVILFHFPIHPIMRHKSKLHLTFGGRVELALIAVADASMGY